MAGGSRVPRRRISWVRRHRRGSKLGGRGGENSDLVLKPGNRCCGEWICVRGHRIRLEGRMRVDTNGNVYVLDSEDEDSGMEVEASGVKVASLGDTAVPGDDLDVAAEGSVADGVKVVVDAASTDEMHPKLIGINIELYSMHSSMFIFLAKIGLRFFELIDFIFQAGTSSPCSFGGSWFRSGNKASGGSSFRSGNKVFGGSSFRSGKRCPSPSSATLFRSMTMADDEVYQDGWNECLWLVWSLGDACPVGLIWTFGGAQHGKCLYSVKS